MAYCVHVWGWPRSVRAAYNCFELFNKIIEGPFRVLKRKRKTPLERGWKNTQGIWRRPSGLRYTLTAFPLSHQPSPWRPFLSRLSLERNGSLYVCVCVSVSECECVDLSASRSGEKKSSQTSQSFSVFTGQMDVTSALTHCFASDSN